MTTCRRCYCETDVTTMSRFSTKIICLDCEEQERKSPHYKRAAAAELEAVKRGDYNYPGIGECYVSERGD